MRYRPLQRSVFRASQTLDSVKDRSGRVMLDDAPYLTELRRRLGDLSWLMRCLAEPIARRANVEDRCKGRFWEGRYKCQLLCDERAVLAAMAYVDLNPIRAGMADRLESSAHTSVQQRIVHAQHAPRSLERPLPPTSGSLLRCLSIHTGEHLALVDWMGRQLREGKRGAIPSDTPNILQSLGPTRQRWSLCVNAIGSGYWRVVGEAHDLIATAQRIGQQWVKEKDRADRLTHREDHAARKGGGRVGDAGQNSAQH